MYSLRELSVMAERRKCSSFKSV